MTQQLLHRAQISAALIGDRATSVPQRVTRPPLRQLGRLQLPHVRRRQGPRATRRGKHPAWIRVEQSPSERRRDRHLTLMASSAPRSSTWDAARDPQDPQLAAPGMRTSPALRRTGMT